MMRRGILLIGHGSRNGKSREVLETIASIMQEKSGIITLPCFLEFDKPGVSDGLAEIIEKAEEITAVPMLFAEGTHSKETIPTLLGLAGSQHRTIIRKDGTAVRLTYTEPIGADPELADILLRKAGINRRA